MFLSIDCLGQAGLYTVTGDKVIIRSGPGIHYTKLGSHKKGDAITVLSLHDGEWARIRFGNTEGYMSRKYIVYKGKSATSDYSQNENKNRLVALNKTGLSDKGSLWLWVGIAVIAYILSLIINDSAGVLSILFNLISAGSLFVWLKTCQKCFWYLDYEKGTNLLVYFFFFVLTLFLFYTVAQTAWNNLKLIKVIRNDPGISIIGFAIGIVWGILLLNLTAKILDEHSLLCFLTLVGFIPSHTPTIYVAGEGHITGHGYNGGDRFHGDNGYDYWYDGNKWHPE